jgi:hypothetical protein
LWNANTDNDITGALKLPSVTGVITDSPHLMRTALTARPSPPDYHRNGYLRAG